MNIFHMIRSNEWWYSKFPPLLAIGYATANMAGKPLYQLSFWLLFLLCALVAGAVYVSLINDITDLEEDLASGKPNRMEKIPARYRRLLPLACILPGLGTMYVLYPDTLSCLLYLLPWISFSLYSLPPFRLKTRGVWGVIADACGSHLFISLLMVSSISYMAGQPIDWIWFSGTGMWAFCYGLRGILFHQFTDRNYDLSIGLTTYASKIEPVNFKRPARLILMTELAALACMLYRISSVLPLAAFAVYLLLLLIRTRRFGYQAVIILAPEDRGIEIVMADYYQLFLPLSILLTSVWSDYKNSLVLIVFILLFPAGIKRAARDLLIFSGQLLLNR